MNECRIEFNEMNESISRLESMRDRSFVVGDG
jgi:hypothetical protein